MSSCTAAPLDSSASRANRLSKNSASAFKSANKFSSKPACPAGLRDRVLSLIISEFFRSQRRKIRPKTNPIPSALKIAFVGFSRTYCSASSWNVRARSLASPHACSALPRASPQACSALPRYSPAIAPAADFKSSAALRACSLLLCNLFCAFVEAGVCCSGLFSSAIGNLQLTPKPFGGWFVRCDYPHSSLNGQTLSSSLKRSTKGIGKPLQAFNDLTVLRCAL